ncbi:type II toxin-antitoxin system YafO family toxin [Serratia rubidaea]|nr:type II toxin-antitoxin system YafO family toxin [Serratia rubidaea]
MSSSVPPDGNKPKQTYTFKGRVFHDVAFSEFCKSDPELQKVADAFKSYWLNGYHPDIGKSIAFSRPKEVLDLCVMHSHVDTKDYTPEESKSHISGKKSSWDAWKRIGSVSVKMHRPPTSDSFIVYSVNNNRDALVIFFLDADAHSMTESSELMESAIKTSYRFFEQTKSQAMPLDEDLFSDKWKN